MASKVFLRIAGGLAGAAWMYLLAVIHCSLIYILHIALACYMARLLDAKVKNLRLWEYRMSENDWWRRRFVAATGFYEFFISFVAVSTVLATIALVVIVIQFHGEIIKPF